MESMEKRVYPQLLNGGISLGVQFQIVKVGKLPMVYYYFTDESLDVLAKINLDVKNSVVLLFEQNDEKPVDKLYKNVLQPDSMESLFKDGMLKGRFEAFAFVLEDSLYSTPMAKVLTDYFVGLFLGDEHSDNLITYANQMESILKVHGVNVPIATDTSATVDADSMGNRALYYPKDPIFRHKAIMMVVDGVGYKSKYILAKDSIVQYPKESTRHYKDGFYATSKKIIDDFAKSGKLKLIGNREFRAMEDVEVNSPSRVAIMISGSSKSGNEFFVDIKGRDVRFT